VAIPGEASERAAAQTYSRKGQKESEYLILELGAEPPRLASLMSCREQERKKDKRSPSLYRDKDK